jgi:hypothetical protein
MTMDLVSRLAAANPVPGEVLVAEPQQRRLNPRRAGLALALGVAVAVPAFAFADDIGSLVGISNQGSIVATSSLSLAHDTKLAQAMQELGDPSTMHLLGTLNGVSFYAAQRPDGRYCFALDAGAGKGFGCDGGETVFPSAQKPIIGFPPHAWLRGFAADGVAAVAAVDASGAVLVSTPVVGNVFAGGAVPGAAVAFEALDAAGNVLATRPFPPNP